MYNAYIYIIAIIHIITAMPDGDCLICWNVYCRNVGECPKIDICKYEFLSVVWETFCGVNIWEYEVIWQFEVY